MEKRIDRLIKSFSEEKLKNTIKVDILNDLRYIGKFITSSPGIISPAKVSEKMKSVEGYLSVWVRNKELTEEVKSLFQEITDRYINLVESEEEKTTILPETVIEAKKSSVKSSIIPWSTKRLYNDVEIKKYDVSYLPVGPCNHYCLVYKVVGDKTYVIPLTTNTEVFNGYMIEKSRFFKGMAIFSLYQFPTSLVKDHFVLPYDHKGEANKIIKSLEDLLKSMLPRERKPKK